MSTKINDGSMSLEIDGRVIATAEFREHAAADGHGAWAVSCHPGRLFTRNQAIRPWCSLTIGSDGNKSSADSPTNTTSPPYAMLLRKSRSPVRIVFPSPTRSVLIAPEPGGELGRGPGCDLVAFGDVQTDSTRGRDGAGLAALALMIAPAGPCNT